MSRVFLLAAAASLLLGGCAAIGGPKTEVKVYAPTASITPDPAWPAADWSLSIGVTAANQMLDSSRIAVRPTPNRFQAYKGAMWTDSVPELLQTTLVEGFEDSGKITAVGRFGAYSRGEYGLVLEVRAFETVYTGDRPEAVIEVQAMLVRLRGGGRSPVTKRFRQVVPGTSPDLDSMVLSFSQALSNISTEIVGWTLVEGDRLVKAPAEESAGT
ncbi:ABC-type transport auxiliary lipoprotein family protein [Arenimonas daejeonensis]|uniref:ABC-type transport auxiliary lipoprotein family protein n=1 Tax=Arenimonas daejeonensis TaxID=370777 RepID=UPI0011BF25E3|nr:ABC-type transport auxiliary lipoprotein family protein [Arenimonas daejeonensis]